MTDDWRPIETVPRGWVVIICRAGDADSAAGYLDDEGRANWIGFQPRIRGGKPAYPTHWMPLPSPPLPEE
jgi:hypothetical protein